MTGVAMSTSGNSVHSGPGHHLESFEGPLGLKYALEGAGFWRAGGRRWRVDASAYLVLNRGQAYGLEMDRREKTRTFCPFFAPGFVEQVQRAMTRRPAELLDAPEGAPPAVEFEPCLRPADSDVGAELRNLRSRLDNAADPDDLDDGFRALAEALLSTREDVRREAARIPAARPQTREELLRRLCRGRDFLHAHHGEPLSMKRAAKEAGLSLHHFHRLFRSAFRTTPHRYATRLRIDRAQRLLESTDWPVSRIALEVGFATPAAFSRRFASLVGVPPAHFRAGVAISRIGKAQLEGS